MIYRIWHGWTTPQNADAYERLVEAEVFEMIAAKTELERALEINPLSYNFLGDLGRIIRPIA